MDVAHCFDFCSFFIWLFLLLLQMLKLIGFDLGVGVGVQVEVGRKVWIYVGMFVLLGLVELELIFIVYWGLLAFFYTIWVGAWICAAHLHLFSSSNNNISKSYKICNNK